MRIKLIIPLLLLMGCIPPVQIGHFKMDTTCNLAIVEGEINGKKTHFLMDTGATLTTLDISQSKHFGFNYLDNEMQISGFTNNVARIKEVIGIKSMKINDVDVTGEILYTTNITNLVKFIEQCSHKTISGIIGVPIIREHCLVIDVTNNKIYKNQ